MLETTQHTTAILVFANSANAELVQKPFAKDERLFEEFTEQTIAKVQKSGLPYFLSTEKEQVGTTFGERLAQAIQQVYERGYTNVIAIGNDSPQLRTVHLLKAYKQLQLNKTVLGPTFDGGFYLLGLHRSNFRSELFKKLPWQRFSLCTTLSQIFQKSRLEVFRLPVFADIDSKKDALYLLGYAKTLPKSIVYLLCNLLVKPNKVFSQKKYLYDPVFLTTFFNKGSPFPQTTKSPF